MAKKGTEVWLSGYYPPTIDDWESWQGRWSMGPHAEADWVWFDGGYFTEDEAREYLKTGPKKGEEPADA